MLMLDVTILLFFQRCPSCWPCRMFLLSFSISGIFLFSVHSTNSYWVPSIYQVLCRSRVKKKKKTHMVPIVLKYGGFQFYSRWSKSTFSLLMTQNWMKGKEQLPEDSESKQKQVDWEGESNLWRSISFALVALTWR